MTPSATPPSQSPRTPGPRKAASARWALLPAALLLGCVGAGPETGEPDVPVAATPPGGELEHCVEAERFLMEDRGMEARIAPDTIDDWRTQQMVPGCRVTAAGRTDLSMSNESQRFYDRLRAAGWTRTPDPRDAPAESSLRFRMGETDCLFNFYEGILLFTEDELEVSTLMAPEPGEARYNVLVLCKPAMEAAPRGGDTLEGAMGGAAR